MVCLHTEVLEELAFPDLSTLLGLVKRILVTQRILVKTNIKSHFSVLPPVVIVMIMAKIKWSQMDLSS